ncbi:hypothetical protein [Nocardia sp. NPDC051570]|uniref:hypothetical protein n=1 Tax=Nocardia sp. NPDC051570 TaxID=3364324 RepID=UPI00378EF36D
MMSRTEVARRRRALVAELVHLRRLRAALLCAELVLRDIPHLASGDVVVIELDGLWWEVFPWLRDGRRLTWIVDFPHPDLEGHSGHQIGHSHGIRFRVAQIPAMWARYQRATGDQYPLVLDTND